MLAGDRHGVTETERLALADVVDVGDVVDDLDVVELVELPRLLEVVLELEVPIEVVFDRRFPRPVMMRMSVMPACTASSTTYWIDGLSTTGNISFG